MQTITVELPTPNALKLLQQLEQLNILRLVEPQKQVQKTKRTWANSLSKQTAMDMLDTIQQSRKEWERTI